MRVADRNAAENGGAESQERCGCGGARATRAEATVQFGVKRTAGGGGRKLDMALMLPASPSACPEWVSKKFGTPPARVSPRRESPFRELAC